MPSQPKPLRRSLVSVVINRHEGTCHPCCVAQRIVVPPVREQNGGGGLVGTGTLPGGVRPPNAVPGRGRPVFFLRALKRWWQLSRGPCHGPWGLVLSRRLGRTFSSSTTVFAPIGERGKGSHLGSEISCRYLGDCTTSRPSAELPPAQKNGDGLSSSTGFQMPIRRPLRGEYWLQQPIAMMRFGRMEGSM